MKSLQFYSLVNVECSDGFRQKSRIGTKCNLCPGFRKHLSRRLQIENACISPTHLADVTASKKVSFKDKYFSSDECKGSKGGLHTCFKHHIKPPARDNLLTGTAELLSKNAPPGNALLGRLHQFEYG